MWCMLCDGALICAFFKCRFHDFLPPTDKAASACLLALLFSAFHLSKIFRLSHFLFFFPNILVNFWEAEGAVKVGLSAVVADFFTFFSGSVFMSLPPNTFK